MHYDEVARVTYVGQAPATVLVRLDGAPAWWVPMPARITMEPGETRAIPLDIELQGDAAPAQAILTATVLAAGVRDP